MGGGQTLRREDLYNLEYPCACSVFHIRDSHIFSNCHFCDNVFDFTREYLRANIGEPVFMKWGRGNPQVKAFLGDLISAIGRRGKREKAKEILNFVDEFHKFQYSVDLGRNEPRSVDSAFEDGGIGIIHTTINLGE